MRPRSAPEYQATTIVLSALAALGLMAIVGWPILATLLQVLRPQEGLGGALLDSGGAGYDQVARPTRLALETIRLVLATEALALGAGIPLALLLARTNAWGRGLAWALLGISLFVPMPLIAAGWLGGFGNAGRSQALGAGPVLVGWSGAAFVHAVAALPWVVFLSSVGFRAVEPELEDSARLDRPGWRVLVEITLRRSLGAMAAAALAVAVLTAGDMTVTALLQVQTYAEEAYTQYGLGRGPGTAAAVALPPTLFLGTALWIGGRALERIEPERLGSPLEAPRSFRLGAWRYPLGLLGLGFVLILVGLPLYALVWRAGRVGGSAALGIGPSWSATGLLHSLQAAAADTTRPLAVTALWASVGAMLTACLAWVLAWNARTSRVWRQVAWASVALLLACPGPVAGMAMVVAYVRVSVIYDTPAIVVLTYVQRALPFAFLVVWPAVRGIPRVHLESASVESGSSWHRLGRVAIPLTRSTLIASGFVAFVIALGELPATNAVAPPGVDLLSVYLWSLLHTGVESHLAAVGLVSLGALAGASGLAALALERSWRTLGRC